MADHGHATDLPALILRSFNEFQKEHQSEPGAGQFVHIAAQIERMLGAGAYESAILLMGRTFVPSWSPCLSFVTSPGTVLTPAGLGRALLKDLLDAVLAEPAGPAAE